MLNPLKWKYEDRVGLLVATLAGAGLGIVAGGALAQYGWLNMLIWGLIGAFVVGAWVYWYRAFRKR